MPTWLLLPYRWRILEMVSTDKRGVRALCGIEFETWLIERQAVGGVEFAWPACPFCVEIQRCQMRRSKT